MVVFKLPKMTKQEMWKLIRRQRLCRIAFKGAKYPYMAPFQYVVLNGVLYFHFTDYGKKREILKKNNNVCVSIEHFEENLTEYYFISIQGKLLLLEETEEKEFVIHSMLEEARGQFSKNFLTAHGFEKDKGWKAFERKDLLIYKLHEVGERIGLKSL
jgi:nitroimidazol reductase NimA-like FMN-containing flavoprotein (pyridoxamine 5'-phosphate oxidase superfamily)